MFKLKFGRWVFFIGNYEGFDDEEICFKKFSFKIKEIIVVGLKVSDELFSDNKNLVEWGMLK